MPQVIEYLYPPPPPPIQPFSSEQLKKSTAPYKVHNMRLPFIKIAIARYNIDKIGGLSIFHIVQFLE
jgi:hypothetical protein